MPVTVLSRWQLPVDSPISPLALPRAAAAAIAGGVGGDRSLTAVRGILAGRFGASAVALTDSGTSALVIAMRLVAPRGSTVALPAYGCPDLVAAAIRAGVRVRFYDLDPRTLSPDLDSVRAAVARGVRALIVVHWYGYPTDVAAASAIAQQGGAVVIEDAAQHADGRIRGRPLGTTGPLTVLSFGRGKGTTAGAGGALLAVRPAWTEAVESWTSANRARGTSRGWRVLGGAAAQWVFGRPSLYGIPAGIPGLHLGETRYRAAHEPAGMPVAAAELLRNALPGSEAVWEHRSRVAAALAREVEVPGSLEPVQPLDGAEPGYLRLAVRDLGGRRPVPSAGIVRGYPCALDELPESEGVAEPGQSAMTGARELCRTLFTLPTHSWVGDRDRRAIAQWATRRSSAA